MNLRILILSLLTGTFSFAQTSDTLTTTDKSIACKVREIGYNDITYTLPGEDVLYRVPRNTVTKIAFASGRTEVITSQQEIAWTKTLHGADTIITYTATIVCKVRQVNRQEISYVLPFEEATYRIPARAVVRIAFASGRSEIFNAMAAYPLPRGSHEWPMVKLSFNPHEVGNMVPVSLAVTKASGATTYSSVTNTQSRAYEKMQQAAAIMGGNVVYVAAQSIEGNMPDIRATRTQLTGQILRSMPLDTTGLGQNLKGRHFRLMEVNTLGLHDTRVHPTPITTSLEFRIGNLRNVRIVDGLVLVEMSINQPVSTFVLTHHDGSSFRLGYKYRNRYTELVFQAVSPPASASR